MKIKRFRKMSYDFLPCDSSKTSVTSWPFFFLLESQVKNDIFRNRFYFVFV